MGIWESKTSFLTMDLNLPRSCPLPLSTSGHITVLWCTCTHTYTQRERGGNWTEKGGSEMFLFVNLSHHLIYLEMNRLLAYRLWHSNEGNSIVASTQRLVRDNYNDRTKICQILHVIQLVSLWPMYKPKSHNTRVPNLANMVKPSVKNMYFPLTVTFTELVL